MSNPQITIKPKRVSVTIEARETTVLRVGTQGAAGPAGDARVQFAEADSLTLPGQPLYLTLSGHAALASAAHTNTSAVCGLAATNALATIAVGYLSDGTLEQPDWTAIVGTTELATGALYYLSPEAGKLTTIAPTVAGQVVVAIGRATTPQRLDIEIQPSIWL